MLELHDQEALELITAHRRWLFNDRRGKRADLSLRTLRGLDLHGVDLTRAKMTGAQFINCNLDGAILVEADLFGVNLTGTSFRRSNCNHADFRGAILSAADFTEAKLMGCDFRDGTLLVSIAGTVAPPEMEKGSVSGTKMQRADLGRRQAAPRRHQAHRPVGGGAAQRRPQRCQPRRQLAQGRRPARRQPHQLRPVAHACSTARSSMAPT